MRSTQGELYNVFCTIHSGRQSVLDIIAAGPAGRAGHRDGCASRKSIERPITWYYTDRAMDGIIQPNKK